MVYVEMVVVVLLILLNGGLAMSELSILTARSSRLQHLANLGSRGARLALRLKDDPSRFLSTIQIGITMVGIIAGAFSGATMGNRLGAWLNSFPVISPNGAAIGISVTVILITYLTLIIGELVPKRIALTYPERVACFVAPPMQVISVVAAPLVWFLKISIDTVLRVLRLTGSRDTTVTEEEVKSLIAEGAQTGIFMPQEKEMISGVLRLADRPVRVIMTPRTKITWLDVNADRDSTLKVLDSNRFSRLLVCDGSVDQPVGVVHTKNLLSGALRGEDIALAKLMTSPFFVPDRTPVLRLLDLFKSEKVHIAVVIDEYGATEGLVTLVDVLESITGEMPERGDDAEPLIKQKGDGSWLVDGLLPIDEVEAHTGLTGLSEGGTVRTMAGFALQQLRRLPEVSARFSFGDAAFEVVEMEDHRIKKVLIETDRHHPPDAPP